MFWGYPPTWAGNRDREQNEAHTIQGETVTGLLHHSDTQVYEARWDATKGAGYLSAYWLIFHDLVAKLATQEGPSWLDFDKHDSHL